MDPRRYSKRIQVALVHIRTALTLLFTGCIALGAGGCAVPIAQQSHSTIQEAPAPRIRPMNGADASPSAPTTTLVQIAPCRLLDTRIAGGPFTNGETRTYTATGHCGIPQSAVALQASVTTTGATRAGYLTAWGAGRRPSTNFATYGALAGMTVGTELPLVPATTDFKIAATGGPTQVLVDVTGYYQQQVAGFIDFTGTPFAPIGTGITNVAFGNAPNSIYITTDRDLSDCTPIVNIIGATDLAEAYIDYPSDTNTVRVVESTTLGGSPPQYQPFYFTVIC